tara:strand:+ start:32 stop:1612 length:1581 start_codon:yes stop_codon:yes gene_type:complete
MGFLNKIFSSKKENKSKNKIKTNLKEIGETDKCPYCKKILEKIPARKSKCPYCNEYMYSRTRPSDRKKVLVTEKQKEEIEEQWTKYYEIQEESNLMENPEFVSAKKELTKQFGKEPSINDIKWRVFNQNIINYASKKQWGLYRNNKLDMAFLLQKENKLKQSLSTLFEVIYLDVNGCNNVGIFEGKAPSQKEMEEYGIKEFDPKMAFLAPGVIGPVQDLVSELQLSEKQAKELFISTNKRMKPVKTMPISEEQAWDKLQKEITIREANEKKIEKFDAEDIDAVIKEIKEATKNKDTLSSIVYKFRDKYKTKKMIVPNANKIKKVIEELLNSSEETKNLGVSLLMFFVKKDKDLFEPLVQNYIKQNKKYFEKCPEEHTIGELGKIEPKWVQDLIPVMIKALTQNPEWNTRRFVAFNLGSIGSKHPELIKEAIPLMIDYIKNPKEVTKRKPTRVEAKGVVIEMNLSAESMLGVDQTQWLKDAYIDSLGMIAKGDKNLIEPYKSLFEKIAKKDKNEYSRKKAQKLLELL